MIKIVDYICDDVLKYITTFNRCSDNIILKHTSKHMNKIIPCKGSKYKNLFGCSKHIHHDDVSFVINTLNHYSNVKKFDYVIHFQSKRQLMIAEKYLTDFGKISHFCCSNKGVVYHDKNSKLSNVHYLNNINNYL